MKKTMIALALSTVTVLASSAVMASGYSNVPNNVSVTANTMAGSYGYGSGDISQAASLESTYIQAAVFTPQALVLGNATSGNSNFAAGSGVSETAGVVDAALTLAVNNSHKKGLEVDAFAQVNQLGSASNSGVGYYNNNYYYNWGGITESTGAGSVTLSAFTPNTQAGAESSNSQAAQSGGYYSWFAPTSTSAGGSVAGVNISSVIASMHGH